jgi:hypothetical protein
VAFHMIDFLDAGGRRPVLRAQLRKESAAFAALDRMANALKPAHNIRATKAPNSEAEAADPSSLNDAAAANVATARGATVDPADSVFEAAQFLRGKILGDRAAPDPDRDVTYYVVIPFDRNVDGFIVPGVAQETISIETAERRARRLAGEHAGVIAFSRTGNAGTGDFQDAVILLQVGDVDLNALGW